MCLVGSKSVGKCMQRETLIGSQNDFLVEDAAFPNYAAFCDSFGKIKNGGKVTDVFESHPKHITNFVCLLGDFDDAVHGTRGCSVTLMTQKIKELCNRFQGHCSVGFILDDMKARCAVVGMCGLQEASVPALHLPRTCLWHRLALATDSKGFLGLDQLDDDESQSCQTETLKLLGVQGISGNESDTANGVMVDFMIEDQHCTAFISGLDCSSNEDENLRVHCSPFELVTLVHTALVQHPPEKQTPDVVTVLSRPPSESQNTLWNKVIEQLEGVCDGVLDTDTSDIVANLPAPLEVFPPKNADIDVPRGILGFVNDASLRVKQLNESVDRKQLVVCTFIILALLVWYVFGTMLSYVGVRPLALANLTSSGIIHYGRRQEIDYVSQRHAMGFMTFLIAYSLFTGDFTNFTISATTTFADSGWYEKCKDCVLWLCAHARDLRNKDEEEQPADDGSDDVAADADTTTDALEAARFEAARHLAEQPNGAATKAIQHREQQANNVYSLKLAAQMKVIETLKIQLNDCRDSKALKAPPTIKAPKRPTLPQTAATSVVITRIIQPAARRTGRRMQTSSGVR